MSYKMLILDVEGVLMTDENHWLRVHEAFGTLEEGKILTEKYLHSNYDKLVEEVVVKLWKGRAAKPYFDVIKKKEYLKGIDEFFDFVKKQGWKVVLITGASIEIAKRIQKEYFADYIFGNELVVREGIVTGEFIWPVGAGLERKAKIIRKLCNETKISEEECIYIGNARPDLEAFKEVGKSIAFNCHDQELRREADFVVEGDVISDTIPILRKFSKN